jgi:hypothetical protein
MGPALGKRERDADANNSYGAIDDDTRPILPETEQKQKAVEEIHYGSVWSFCSSTS